MNHKEKYREECRRIRASREWKRETALRMEQRGTRRGGISKWVWTGALAAVLACVLAFSPLIKPATVEAKENLMQGVQPKEQEIPASPDSAFVSAQAEFAVRLFQKAAGKSQNILVSPVSAALALGMTANGAKGRTLSQFQNLLGGGMSLSELDRNFASEQALLKSSPAGKVLLASSIWYRDKDLTVQKPFLQNNADFFGANAFRLDFSSPAAVGQINSWVSQSTNGKITKMVDRISPNDMMYLFHALYLEQDWKFPYNGSVKGTFHAPSGDRTVSMMSSAETYLHDGTAEGILKPFRDSRYEFAAILPKNGVSADEYLGGMTGKSFLSLMRSSGGETAVGTLPKFKFDCSLTLNKALISLGLSDAFDGSKADFSAMGSSSRGHLYLNGVTQKTFIQADELGLKAGAVTEVASGSTCARVKPRTVDFDRPFLIAVVEAKTDLPVFFGIVADPAE